MSKFGFEFDSSNEKALPDHTIPLIPGVRKPDLPEIARRLDPDTYEEIVDWYKLSRCAEVDPQVFTSDLGGPRSIAKKICYGCEVGLDCAHEAVVNHDTAGVWGGMTEQPLREIRKMLGMDD